MKLFFVFCFLVILNPVAGKFLEIDSDDVVQELKKQKGGYLVRNAGGEEIFIAANRVTGRLSVKKAKMISDRFISQVGNPERHEAVMRGVRKMGMAAVPRLIQVAGDPKKKKKHERIGALSLLQFVWSFEGEEALFRLLEDRDVDVQEWAWRIAKKRLSEDGLRRLLKRLSKSERLDVAMEAKTRLLLHRPNLTQLKESLKDERWWDLVSQFSPRYYDGQVGMELLKILDKGSEQARRNALIALIYQFDQVEKGRRVALRCLKERSAELRGVAGEYLRWHGTFSELEPLKERLRVEKDVYVRAVVLEAVRAIKRRGEKWEGKLEVPLPTYEPFFRYGFREETDSDLMGVRKRLNGFRSYSGYNGARMGGVKKTGKWVAPVRGYFEVKRKSYGLYIEKGGGPFSGSVHVGDDAAWGKQHGAVVAIGDGVVRYVQVAAVSWGGLVVVEHDNGQEKFCSLYAHLGPLVTVQEGDRVRAGMMLGSLGRDFVFSSGGYYTHIHFGIHKGAYGHGRWSTGYLSKHRFDGGAHGWVDPIEFLRKRIAQ